MRVARVTVPGAVHHIISRFIDRRWLLRHPEERAHYLGLLGRALDHTDWICLAYGLMSSHLHLAMVAGRRRAESWLKRTHSPFATWLKDRHDGLGVLFAGRPKMTAVFGEEKVRDLLAYIHNNPVRGGVVRHADESDWTSHRAYIGKSVAPSWLSVGEGLRRGGIPDPAAFHAYVLASEHVKQLEETDRILAAVAKQAHRRGAIEVATPEISERTTIPLVARPFAAVRPDPSDVVDVVTGLFGKNREASFGRRRAEAIYIRRHIFAVGLSMGLTLAELAAATGISGSSASRLAVRPTDDLDADVISVGQRRLALNGRNGKASPLKGPK